MSTVTGIAEALADLGPEEEEQALAALSPAQLIDIDRDRLRGSLRAFVEAAWPIADPSEFVGGMHVDAICQHLEAVTRGEIRRLLICVPPRHSKSLIVSVLFPAWVWTHRPEWRSLFVSHAATLAVEHSRLCRQVVESEWYRRLFCFDWRLAPDQNAKDYYSTTKGGHRFSIGMTGNITGHGGDVVIVDDPISALDAYSDAVRLEAKRVISKVLPSRLNNRATGGMVMIMQRLHEDDPAGHVLRTGAWQHLNLPTEYDPRRQCVTYTTTGRVFWRDPRTIDGELLCPARFNREQVEEKKKELDADEPGGFDAQENQNPTPAGGNIFKNAWWRYWKPDGVGGGNAPRPVSAFEGPARVIPAKFDQVILTLDANFKDKKSADPISLLALGRLRADTFVLARIAGPIGFGKTKAATRAMHELIEQQYGPIRAVLIEDKANGSAIIEELQSEIEGVLAIEPEGGKQARAWAIQPQVQAGNVYLPDGADWVNDFIGQHASFPKGRHDDDVDALSQGLVYLKGHRAPTFSYPEGTFSTQAPETE